MRAEALVIAFALAACISAAAVADTPPAPLQDKGRTPVSIERQYDIAGFVDGRATGLICPVRFTDPYFGYLSEITYEIEHKAPASMQCFTHDNGVVLQGWAKLNEASGRWLVSLPPEDEKLFAGKTRIYQLSSANASGWAVTIDDVIGDERGRRRMLHYCLIHPPKALCGDGEMGYVQDIKRHPKNDLTSYALKILRSIEFLDESASAPGSAASQASSAR